MKKKIQKPFDAEAAKRGAKVETREGNPVRIVCYDRKGNYPIITLVDYGDTEDYSEYSIEGKYIHDCCSNEDLVLVEEVECPKFKEGDYVVLNQNYTYKVNYIDTMYHTYHLVCINNNSFIRPDIEEIDKSCHKWTIQDAKPGDVLVSEDGYPFIYAGNHTYAKYLTAYCGITNDVFKISNKTEIWTNDNVEPATYKEKQQFFNRLLEEGYKWDAESLTLSKIQKRWRDDEHAPIDGYYINGVSQIVFRPGDNRCCYNNTFATEKQAKSALAMARISQIMANDKRFGGVITDEEWNNKHNHVILRKGNYLDISIRYGYQFLAFHEKEQAKLFLEENKDLVKDYYMLG